MEVIGEPKNHWVDYHVLIQLMMIVFSLVYSGHNTHVLFWYMCERYGMSCTAYPGRCNFQSDRRNSPAFTDAYLSGTFPVAWNGTAYPMSDDDGDSIYTVVMSLTPGTIDISL